MNKAKLNLIAFGSRAHILRLATWSLILFFTAGIILEGNAQHPMPPTIPQNNAEVFGPIGSGNLFYSPLVVGPPGPNVPPPAAAMADSVGNLLWYYHAFDTSGNISQTRIRDFKVFWDGTMVFGLWDQFFTDHTYLVLDTNFDVIDSIECLPYELDAHDIVKSLDGHYHLTCFIDSIMDASVLTNTEGLPGSKNAFVVGLLIRELDENLNIVKEWNSLEHYELTDMYEEFFNTDTDFVDFTHTNAIALDLDSNWVVSHRHLNEISCIDPNTGDFVWRLNGKQSSFTFPDDSFTFSGQHDCRIMPNGNVTLFDNATLNSNPNAFARGLEYKLDTVLGVATKVYEIAEPSGLPAGFIGNMQRLDNGNSLVGWGGILPTTAGITMSEHDASGAIMMTFDIEGALSYRVKRHEFPYTFNRPPLNYNPFTFTLSTDPASQYIWSTGATTQSIAIDEAGLYRVHTPYGIGFAASKTFTVPDIFTSIWETDVTDESATLNWDAVTGAVSYNVRYRTANGGSFQTASSAGTSKTISGLDPGQTYEWQVQAVYGATNSLYSLTSEFTTISFGPPEPIFTSNITFTSARLNWTPNAEAIQYFLRGKQVDASAYIYVVIPASESFLDVSSLPEGTAFNWQIATIFESGISDFSDMDTFATQKCEAPANLSTTGITSNSAVLNWDVSPNAQSYQLGGRPVGSGTVITIPISNPAQSSYVANGLAPGVSYEWTIISICQGGRISGTPPLETFTTALGPAAKGVASTFGSVAEDLELYPNPAKDRLTIDAGANYDGSGYHVFIIDLNGRTVHSSFNNEVLVSIDVAELPNGVYMVNIQSETIQQTEKLIIAR